MRKLIRAARLGAAALLCWAALAGAAGAQVLLSDEAQRALRPGVYVPYDGMNLQQRYNFGTGGFLYFNGSARQVYMLDYLDRLDRAERFGYRPPPDPFYRRAPIVVYHPDGTPYADPPPPPPVYYYRR